MRTDQITSQQVEPSNERPMPAVSRGIGLVAGIYLLLGGIVSLLGWVLDVPRLTDWDGNGISIMPNAAVCAFSTGAGLMALSLGRARLARAFGLVVAFFAFGTALEHIANVQLFDNWFLFGREWGREGVIVPGRMGLVGTVSWCVISSALIALSVGLRFHRWAAIAALAVLSISSVSLIGYAFQAENLYSIPLFTVIALQTASFIWVGGIGLVSLAHDREPARTLLTDDAAGALARRVLPWALATPLLARWMRMVGERNGVFSAEYGIALGAVLEMLVIGALLWSGVRLVSAKERALKQALEVERILKSQIAEREEFAQGVLGTLPDAFCVLDNEWRFTFLNQHFADRTGKSVDHLLGKSMWDEFPEAVGTEGYHHLQTAMEQRTNVEYNVFYEPYQKHFRDKAHVTASGLSVYSTDITESKKQEQELQDIDRRKDVFLATLAHELRNPLAPICLSLDLLNMTQDEAVVGEAKAAMVRQVTHMVRLIDDLLDVSRIKQGKVVLQTSRVELRDIVSAAAEDCAAFVQGAGHRLTIELPAEPVYVDGDTIRLTQVLVNLLRNAGKFTPEHGAISLSLVLEERVAAVRVKDNGVGISPDCLEQIFEPFSQVDGTVGRSQGGLGVGLMLCQQLVALHGGELTAQSDGLGKGSEFTVRLPLATGPAGVAAVTMAAPSTELSYRVLVVDDTHDIARCLSLLLEQMGCEVDTALDGKDAIEHAAQFLPDVILLDIGLPDMTGYEVCETIRAKPWGKDITIIALTGWGSSDDLLRAKVAGFDTHVLKPIDLDTLLKVLKRNAKLRV